MRRVSSGMLYHDGERYRFFCVKCYKQSWVRRMVEQFRYWKVFPDQLGPFTQGCGYCKGGNLNPGRSYELFSPSFAYRSLPYPDYFLKPRRKRARTKQSPKI